MKLQSWLLLPVLCVLFLSLSACGPGTVPLQAGTEAPATRPPATEVPPVETTPAEAPTGVPPAITTEPSAEAAPALDALLFDDFSYEDQSALTANGWIVRSGQGWPGVRGASFWQEGVTFVADPDEANNQLMRMVSQTNGTPANTQQTQVCQQRKYRQGTYAARVHFSTEPVTGPDGDQVVETFYAIRPLIDMDPDYSEMDFEYLPNGGWGSDPQTFFMTTWETAQIEPWYADNSSTPIAGLQAGWHTLIIQVAHGEVRYYIDGDPSAVHGGKYYPESPMSINFNLWFIQDGLVNSPDMRQYQEFVDWAFFTPAMLTPGEVAAQIESLRGSSTSFIDTVPAWDPPQDSPCDL